LTGTHCNQGDCHDYECVDGNWVDRGYCGPKCTQHSSICAECKTAPPPATATPYEETCRGEFTPAGFQCVGTCASGRECKPHPTIDGECECYGEVDLKWKCSRSLGYCVQGYDGTYSSEGTCNANCSPYPTNTPKPQPTNTTRPRATNTPSCKSNGSQCGSNSECCSSYCDLSQGMPGTCRTKPQPTSTPKPNGWQCSSNSECQSKYCDLRQGMPGTCRACDNCICCLGEYSSCTEACQKVHGVDGGHCSSPTSRDVDSCCTCYNFTPTPSAGLQDGTRCQTYTDPVLPNCSRCKNSYYCVGTVCYCGPRPTNTPRAPTNTPSVCRMMSTPNGNECVGDCPSGESCEMVGGGCACEPEFVDCDPEESCVPPANCGGQVWYAKKCGVDFGGGYKYCCEPEPTNTPEPKLQTCGYLGDSDAGVCRVGGCKTGEKAVDPTDCRGHNEVCCIPEETPTNTPSAGNKDCGDTCLQNNECKEGLTCGPHSYFPIEVCWADRCENPENTPTPPEEICYCVTSTCGYGCDWYTSNPGGYRQCPDSACEETPTNTPTRAPRATNTLSPTVRPGQTCQTDADCGSPTKDNCAVQCVSDYCPGHSGCGKTEGTSGAVNCELYPPTGYKWASDYSKCISESEPTTVPPGPGKGCKPCPDGSFASQNTSSFKCNTNGKENVDYGRWAQQYYAVVIERKQVPSNQLYGDYNCDGEINVSDHQIWYARWCPTEHSNCD